MVVIDDLLDLSALPIRGLGVATGVLSSAVHQLQHMTANELIRLVLALIILYVSFLVVLSSLRMAFAVVRRVFKLLLAVGAVLLALHVREVGTTVFTDEVTNWASWGAGVVVPWTKHTAAWIHSLVRYVLARYLPELDKLAQNL